MNKAVNIHRALGCRILSQIMKMNYQLFHAFPMTNEIGQEFQKFDISLLKNIY